LCAIGWNIVVLSGPLVYKTDINIIERVQRRFTKRLLGLKEISYHDRLVILDNADTLEVRPLKTD